MQRGNGQGRRCFVPPCAKAPHGRGRLGAPSRKDHGFLSPLALRFQFSVVDPRLSFFLFQLEASFVAAIRWFGHLQHGKGIVLLLLLGLRGLSNVPGIAPGSRAGRLVATVKVVVVVFVEGFPSLCKIVLLDGRRQLGSLVATGLRGGIAAVDGIEVLFLGKQAEAALGGGPRSHAVHVVFAAAARRWLFLPIGCWVVHGLLFVVFAPASGRGKTNVHHRACKLALFRVPRVGVDCRLMGV